VNRYVGAEDGVVPYGFVRTGETADGFAVYERPEPMPVAVVMDSVMTQAEYDALGPLEKQWALLQCAVTEAEELPAAQVRQSVEEIPVLSVETENAEWDGTLLNVGENAVLRLTFDAPAGSELYVEMQALAMYGGGIDLGNRVMFSDGTSETVVNLMPEGFELTLQDRPSVYVNLGCAEDVRTEVTVRFARTGVYRLEGIRMFAQPMAEFETLTAGMRERGLRNAEVGTDRVTGTVELNAPGVLVFSIPAVDGWKAYVDGGEAELTASAETFLALPLESGTHEIELVYGTPGLNIGISISLICTALIMVAMLPDWHSSRRARRKGEQE